MLSSSLLVLASFLCIPQIVAAAPDLLQTVGQSIPLTRRKLAARTPEEWADRAKREREAIILRYGGSLPSKRAQGTNLMTNLDADNRYLGTVAIGTPPKSFSVMLDTGSADLWVKSIDCISGCSDDDTAYNHASSSTFQNLSRHFSATYGSGEAQGDLVSDVVQMAGFQVNNQIFGAVTEVGGGLLQSPMSGLLGLGWQSLATSEAPPMWQTLASQGAWSQPVMAFQLTRFINDSNAQESLEPGGSFTMGFLNSSLYTGNIDYQELVTTPGFWTLSLTELTVQGSSMSLPSGNASHAIIDTGTTLIIGPSSVMQDLYARIPDSQLGTGQWENQWIYPCDSKVNITMSFGGLSWPMNPADFQYAQIGPNACVGAFSPMNSSNGPGWVIGDTFLKNVYSVYRYSPPSVGFAALSETALGMNGVNAPPPSATIGSVTTSVTATVGNATSRAILTSSPTFSIFNPLVMFGLAVGTLLA